LQSTHSSDKDTAGPNSSTEALASRYRHLFVLPSTRVVVFLACFTSVFLSIVADGGAPTIWPPLGALLATTFSSYIVTFLTREIDSSTIASFRRTTAALLVGEGCWTFIALIGFVYSLSVNSHTPLENAIVFGAMVASGLEFVIINGAFIKRTTPSLAFGIMQPSLIMATFVESGVLRPTDPLPALFGLISFITLVYFIVQLKRRRTSRGHNTLELFQAFMKAWANSKPDDLESILRTHSEHTTVSTKIFRLDGKATVLMILPGIHPGPFYPVGSYDLPGRIFHQFKNLGLALSLHRPGGHEKNLATHSDTQAYVQKLYKFALSLEPHNASLRGPVNAQIGKAKTTVFSFDTDAILTISFAPHGSDDLESNIEKTLGEVAKASGFSLGVVDAHNSIASYRAFTTTEDAGWHNLFTRLRSSDAMKFRLGYSNSGELSFSGSSDLTVGGISVVEFETNGIKWILALADANNAVPTLREAVDSALAANGFKLLEFCTTDSHDLAARGLTVTRGYLALGESTPLHKIIDITVRLARLAETRLSECTCASAEMVSEEYTFGTKTLDEFASITQSSARFAKRYAKATAIVTLALFTLALLF